MHACIDVHIHGLKPINIHADRWAPVGAVQSHASDGGSLPRVQDVPAEVSTEAAQGE
jgi:hypothetical protein